MYFFSLIRLFKILIFIFNFLDLHKKQEKNTKKCFFLITYPLVHLFLLSKKAYVKNRCLKPTVRYALSQVNTAR